MVDQFIGLILMGLGIKNQVAPQVKGDSIEVSQEVENTDQIKQDTVEIKNDLRTGNTKELKKDTRQLRTDLLERNKTASREAKIDIEELKTTIKNEKEQHKSEIEAKNTEFKAKLQEIKDERKKNILERIQSNFQLINEHRVEQLTKQLEAIGKILDKVIERGVQAVAAGKDTTSLDTIIASCQTSIATAKDAISVQSGNTYSITLTSEADAKANVGSTRQTLEADLKKVQATMTTARGCVRDALKALAFLFGEKESENTTVTPIVTVAPTETPSL